MQQVIQTPVQQQYVRKLLGFDFVIEYKTGNSNKATDALSRMYEEEEMLESAFLALSTPIPSLLEEVRHECSTKIELMAIVQQLQAGTEVSNYSVRDGILFFKNHYCIAAESSLKEKLLHEFYSIPSAGHCGNKRILVRLSSNFYWKNMRKDMENFISKCLVCQQTKYMTQPATGLLQPLSTPKEVWDDISMNFIVGLPKSKGYTVIFVVVDRLTKYAHFGALTLGFTAR